MHHGLLRLILASIDLTSVWRVLRSGGLAVGSIIVASAAIVVDGVGVTFVVVGPGAGPKDRCARFSG